MSTVKVKQRVSEKKDRKQHARDSMKESAGNLFTCIERLSPSRVILLICLLSFAAYANSLGGDFVFDDTEQIVENPDIRSWDNLGRAFTTHVWEFHDRPDVLRAPIPPPYYRPIFTAMLTVEYKLFGLWPQGWHLTNLLLHMLCSIGVYYVLLILSRRKFVAVISALMFAVFPVHAESVSWISGMTDPLFGVFFLASFYYHLKFRASGKPLFFCLSLAAFAFAAFSKETALSLVFLIFAYEFIEAACNGSSDKKKATAPAGVIAHTMNAGKRSIPYVGVAMLYLMARYMVLGGLTWKNPQTHDGPFADTLLTLPLVIMSYLGHLVWPVGLSVAYMTHFVTSATSLEFILPALALALISGALLVYRKTIGREVWHALALMLAPMIPVFDLRQLSVEYLVFDHYLYLSVAGWCYLLVLGLEKLAASKSAESNSMKAVSLRGRAGLSAALLVILLAGFTASTVNENTHWSDSYSLWSNAAHVRPEFWAAHYNTGVILLESEKFAQARESLDRAASLKPQEPRVFDALGRAHDASGDRANAVSSFKRALELDPTMFESLNNLGTVYFKAGDYSSAEQCFKEALKAKPQAAAARFNLGLCYARQSSYKDAARELEQVALALPEDAEAYYELGLVYEKAGRKGDAVIALERGFPLAKSRMLADKISDSLKRIQSERN